MTRPVDRFEQVRIRIEQYASYSRSPAESINRAALAHREEHNDNWLEFSSDDNYLRLHTSLGALTPAEFAC